jgi:effector-binding domain-containing protein
VKYEVRVVNIDARPSVVAGATTTWSGFGSLWKELLDEVWACVRAAGIERGCRNVMLYRDDAPTVEVGVELAEPIALTGRVMRSNLPAGRVATTVHRGPYDGLASAHEAVLAWCAAHDQAVTRTRWEVYGPHEEDPSRTWTEIYWLLA